MIRYATVLALVFAVGALAQSPPQHQHAANTTVIDGSKTPDQIPDSEAYRLLFLSISLTQDKQNDPQAVARRFAFVKQTGVLPEEIPQVIKVVDDFRSQYETLSAAWNKKATEDQAKGVFDDPSEFLSNINALVQMTQLSLHGALSLDSMLKFHAHAIGFKRNIKQQAR